MTLLHATQLFVGNVITANPTFTTCYTVPAGDRIILRSIAYRNLNGSTVQSLYVKIGGTVVWTAAVAAGGTSAGSGEWRPWIVCPPGQTIQLAASTTTGFGILISGSIYTI